MHKLFSMHLFLFTTLYMFRAHSAHHQERQIVSIQPLVTVIRCWWSRCVQVGRRLLPTCTHLGHQHLCECKHLLLNIRLLTHAMDTISNFAHHRHFKSTFLYQGGPWTRMGKNHTFMFTNLYRKSSLLFSTECRKLCDLWLLDSKNVC